MRDRELRKEENVEDNEHPLVFDWFVTDVLGGE